MKIAFTMDDLPLWPQSYPPPGHSPEGIVAAIRRALADNDIPGVYAFCNSWPLEQHPEMAQILDDWVADGHHVANHTHGHLQLPDVTATDFIADIDRAETHLAPWLSRAPQRLFRHPLCHWGETPEKRTAVNAHLIRIGATPVDVTSWCFEWTFNRAWRNARDADDPAAQAYVRDSFLTFAPAQLRHDMAAARDWFGQDIIGIALGHNVPFFADIASDYFACLKSDGVTFVPLAQALNGPVQDAVGSIVSSDFLVIQQKLAAAAGRPMDRIAPDQTGLFAQISQMAAGRND